MTSPPTSHRERLQRLDALLDACAWLWRPQPFKEARPGWCDELPGLTAELLALSDDALAALQDDNAALLELLAGSLPSLAELDGLSELHECEIDELKELGPHFHGGIPGRKWQQLTTFAGAIGPLQAPPLEWCGGKGHLGRFLAAQWGHSAVTVEWDDGLCASGEGLAEKARIAQRFVPVDALGEAAAAELPGRHAVALHACGELHRTLIRRAVAAQVPALSIAPCCYHLGAGETYRPLSNAATLTLSRDELRLAVTETVTAVEREVRWRDREMAWKLGWQLLCEELLGGPAYRPVAPIDKQWLRGDFAAFCRQLAAREGVTLPGTVDWPRLEAAGWQRQRETMRLSLVRAAFRRALELWLVLDMAVYLEAAGYHVSLGRFCERGLTPRNILLQARR